ncbi:MAG: UDP-N-acetylmuramate--L-alanine ligase [Phycisphaeraceae bacterium]
MTNHPAEHVNPTTNTPDWAAQRIHWVGVAGSGMSGLARMAHAFGASCTGTDRSPSQTVNDLIAHGITVSLDQTGDALPDNTTLLVASAAIPDNHPELQRAQQQDIPTLRYAQMLGRVMSQHTGVAVAGTHGKSTTTSLLSHILIHAQLDPSLIVGAHCAQIGGGYRVGSPKRTPATDNSDPASQKMRGGILVAEACEYARSFHHLHPTHAIILNIEADHLDIYNGIDDIIQAFHTFASQIHPDGSLLIQHELPQRMDVVAGLPCHVETLGFAPQADWHLTINQRTTTLTSRHGDTASFTMPLPGEHMAYNAAAAAITAHRLGAPWNTITHAINTFQGLDRRMQRIGVIPTKNDNEVGGGVTVIDDYGHHPTEIDTTLRALRDAYHPKRLICVFQPHQHSRTRFLMEQFAASFAAADLVIVPEIFFTRDSELDRQQVRAVHLVSKLRQQGVAAMHVDPLDAITEQLKLITQPGDLVVTMGAGNVNQIAHQLINP